MNESSPHHHTPSLTVGKSRLPDPFAELTTDAQALVQNMAEMGFPRPRVARAVQKLGTDHKKVRLEGIWPQIHRFIHAVLTHLY